MSRTTRFAWLARRTGPPNRPPARRKLRAEPLEDRRLLAITVDTLVDEADGSLVDGDVSLRDAIALAPVGETINFSVNGTIALTLGELTIDKDLTIDGPGADLLTIDAGDGDDNLFNTADGHRVFLIDDGDHEIDTHVTLRGLRLTGGDAVSAPGVSSRGGAIYARDGLTLVDSRVTGNAATNRGGGVAVVNAVADIINTQIDGNVTPYQGGGVSVQGQQSALTLTNSTVSNNQALHGGGVHLDFVVTTSGYGNAGEASILGSTITGNTAIERGGGIEAYASRVAIRESTISDNSAEEGGGVALNVTIASEIVDSTLSNNTATRGAGIYGAASGFSFAPTVLRGLTISQNTAAEAGGGLWSDVSSWDISESTFSGNSVTESAGQGGAIYQTDGTLRITQSTLSGNSAGPAGVGGGVRNASGTTTIVNSTLSGNTAGLGQGGGISNDAALVVRHSTLTDNFAFTGGGVNNSAGTATIANSIVAGNRASGLGGTRELRNLATLTVDAYNLLGRSEIDTALALEGVAAGPTDILATSDGTTPTALADIIDTTLANHGGSTLSHALTPGSPAIDAGHPSFSTPPDTDQRGFPFVRQFGSRLDIGAIEDQQAALIVNTLVDENNGSGDFSLREAIDFANTTPGTDSISFDPSLAGGVIQLTLGELDVTDDVSIAGLGADQLTIDGGGSSRVFDVGVNTTATLSGLTITGGNADNGGGIRTAVNSHLTLAAVVVSGNMATSDGGGVQATSNLTVIDSTISGNTAGDDGGGLWIYNDDENFGERAILSNSTISGNSAADKGGGIYTDIGETFVRHTTISDNAAAMGDGVLSRASTLNRTVFESSIVAGNTDNDDVASVGPGSNSIDSSGYNLVGGGNATSSFAAVGDATGVFDPRLAPLGDYGGPTPTHALKLGSPAVDAGDPAAIAGQGNVRLFDQRRTGFDRILGTAIDIGAFEQAALTGLVVDTLDDAVNYDYSPGNVSLRELLEFAGEEPGAQTISFAAELAGGTINLASGQLELTDDVTIEGLGADLLTIDAGGNSRVVHVGVNVTANLSGLTLTGGNATSGGGARTAVGSHVVLTATVISGNEAAGDGGGVQSYGRLTIADSTVSGNDAGDDGGGLWISNDFFTPSGSDLARITGSTISGNTAGGHGGGLYASYGRTILRHSTITGNAANAGDGLASFNDFFNYNRTEVHSSIIAGNGIAGNNDTDDVATTGPGSTSIRSDDYNLVGGGNAAGVFSDPGDQTGVVDPQLGPLAENGGPTPTHLPLVGSAAIDQGNPTAVAGSLGVPANDQRGEGFPRVSGGAIDIGAVEVQVASADFDDDSDVDGRDLLAWQRGFGTLAPNAGRSDGDADNDADVDGADLSVWESQFGQGTPLAASSLAAATTPQQDASDAPAINPRLIDARLIDAAMAREWIDRHGRESARVWFPEDAVAEGPRTAGTRPPDPLGVGQREFQPGGSTTGQVTRRELARSNFALLADDVLARVFG